jgi:hypothetical protein
VAEASNLVVVVVVVFIFVFVVVVIMVLVFHKLSHLFWRELKTLGTEFPFYHTLNNSQLACFWPVAKFLLAKNTCSPLYGCMLSTKGRFMGIFLFLYALPPIFVLFVSYSKHEFIFTVYMYKKM